MKHLLGFFEVPIDDYINGAEEAFLIISLVSYQDPFDNLNHKCVVTLAYVH